MSSRNFRFRIEGYISSIRPLLVDNWSIVSIQEGIAGWIMGYDNKGHVLHSTASGPRTVCRAATGLVSKLDPGEERSRRHGKN
jgi:hypothetical protein